MNPLIEKYLPEPEEVTAADRDAVRRALTAFWAISSPDIDVRPNSVVGDTFMAGAVPVLGAIEKAAERLRSDLTPQNVAAGIIYDCDFVEAFLGNIGVYATPTVAASGTVRLVFRAVPSGAPWELPRNLRFTFDGGITQFSLNLPAEGAMLIYAPGVPMPSGVNCSRLVQVGDSSYVVDLAVVTTGASLPADGASASLSEDLEFLTAANGYAFTGFPATSSLSEVARKTQTASYAATPSTANGLRRFAELEFPGCMGVSATGPGDAEQLRAGFTTLGFPRPAVDLHVRGQRAFRLDEQIVKLVYDAGNQRFVGKFEPLVTPLLIEAVQWEGNLDLLLEPTIWMGAPADLPGCLAAGSGQETYWISLPMPMEGAEELITTISAVGGPFAWFNVVFRGDPEVRNVRDVFMKSAWRSFSQEMLVYPFRVVEILGLTVSYKRASGTNLLLDRAREEIVEHVNSTLFPDAVTEPEWTDSVKYAGARMVLGSTVGARLRWTIADKLIPAGQDPAVNFDDAMTLGVDAPIVEISDIADLVPTYVDPDLGTPSATYAAAGARNVMWFVRPENVYFEEVV